MEDLINISYRVVFFFYKAKKQRTYNVILWRVRKDAVHFQRVLEVMSTSVYKGLNPFNFIRKHFLHICVRKVAVHL
jgi:pilus assembly protein TadC